MPDQFARQIDGALAGSSDAQKNRQQFGIGKRGGALCHQSFARPLVFGPVSNCHVAISVKIFRSAF